MNYWTEEKNQKRRRQQMMAKAEIDRQLPRAGRSFRLPTRVYHILLASLGAILYRWGCSLQARYGRLLLTTEAPEIEFTYSLKQMTIDPEIKTTPCSG